MKFDWSQNIWWSFRNVCEIVNAIWQWYRNGYFAGTAIPLSQEDETDTETPQSLAENKDVYW